MSVGEAYVTELRNTSSDYIVPLDYNGLGYNNLISIYMLVKLTEIQKGRNFRILCLEEPELFNGNNVHKKVLCITDRDFSWINEDGGVKTLSDFGVYDGNVTPHIKKLRERFPISNFHIVTQMMGGRTFEDELFLTNMTKDPADYVVAAKLMSLVANDTVSKLLKDYSLNFASWDANRPTAANSIVAAHLDVFKAAIRRDAEHEENYKQLFFAELFLYYAKNHKGDVALSILTDDTITKDLIVPPYIKEGLEWLLK